MVYIINKKKQPKIVWKVENQVRDESVALVVEGVEGGDGFGAVHEDELRRHRAEEVRRCVVLLQTDPVQAGF